MLTLTHNAIAETNPLAIHTKVNALSGVVKFDEKPLEGLWYRVFPATGRDVFYLMGLELHLDKFAPATGGGVFVHPRAMPLTINRN